MPNTFPPMPDATGVSSTAFLAVPAPAERLETIMEEAQLQRGSLREQDGYTIPFRRGGTVRIKIVEGAEPGLRFTAIAPSADRLHYLEGVITGQAAARGVETGSLDWEPVVAD